MMIELAILVLVSALCFMAGLAGGLYLGEKGRREAAERQLTYGNPAAAPRATVIEGRPDPEARLRDIGADPKTIDNGVHDIMRRFKEAGLPITPEQAREQVQMMLHPDYTPPELPGLGL